jgi:hypothetical protein
VVVKSEERAELLNCVKVGVAEKDGHFTQPVIGEATDGV